jgi:hypothetical protein
MEKQGNHNQHIVHVVSPTFFILSLIASIFGWYQILRLSHQYELIDLENSMYFVLFIILSIPVFVIVIRKSAYAKLSIVTSSESVSFEWIKNFAFYTEENVNILFSEIDSYNIHADRNWKWINIKLNIGTTHSLWVSQIYSGGKEFDDFTQDFENRIRIYNSGVTASAMKNDGQGSKSDGVCGKTVSKEKSFYSTNLGLIAGLFSLLAILFAMYKVVNESDTISGPNFGIILFGVAGCIYYLVKLIKSRLSDCD